MIDILYAIIMLAICILGMLGAFFLGTRKFQERVFEFDNKPRTLEDSDIYEEPTEEEYQRSISSWDFYGPKKEEEEL
jgi:hypothetical protein